MIVWFAFGQSRLLTTVIWSNRFGHLRRLKAFSQSENKEQLHLINHRIDVSFFFCYLCIWNQLLIHKLNNTVIPASMPLRCAFVPSACFDSFLVSFLGESLIFCEWMDRTAELASICHWRDWRDSEECRTTANKKREWKGKKKRINIMYVSKFLVRGSVLWQHGKNAQLSDYRRIVKTNIPEKSSIG